MCCQVPQYRARGDLCRCRSAPRRRETDWPNVFKSLDVTVAGVDTSNHPPTDAWLSPHGLGVVLHRARVGPGGDRCPAPPRASPDRLILGPVGVDPERQTRIGRSEGQAARLSWPWLRCSSPEKRSGGDGVEAKNRTDVHDGRGRMPPECLFQRDCGRHNASTCTQHDDIVISRPDDKRTGYNGTPDDDCPAAHDHRTDNSTATDDHWLWSHTRRVERQPRQGPELPVLPRLRPHRPNARWSHTAVHRGSERWSAHRPVHRVVARGHIAGSGSVGDTGPATRRHRSRGIRHL